MYHLVSVTAKKIDSNMVTINTSKIAKNSEDRNELEPPWWVIGSAAFLFNVERKKCVALVQRTHNVSDPCARV